TSLPDLGGSGDTVFFLASEMKPQAPSNLLVDGLTPLSDSGKKALLDWVKRCRKFVQWNRVFSYGGTDLIIYRQGVARPGEPNKPGNGNLVGATECEPLYVAAIAVHTDAVDTRIAFAEPIGSGRITPSEFFSAYDPIALINGGFFSGPRPLGTMLLDGVHAGKPIVGRSAIGWNNSDGTFSFGRGNAKIGAKTKRGYVEFTKFNVPPPPDEAALYTPDVARSSIGIGLDSLQIVLVNDVVAEVREAREGKFLMPEGGTMMIARGKARAMFDPVQPGEKIKVLTDWENGSFGASTNLIQAGPMLIRENKFTTDTETFKDDVLEKRHPRTIVGTDGKRMIWAVVDGRSAIHSRGATISETRWIAKSLGLTTAINMDGGGSSQIMWRGVMMNLPADGKERPLPYAVMMLPKGMKLVRANSYLNGPDQGEFGEYGYNASEEGVAEYMDTYDPMSTKN
ncbi:MAG: phosphodiester glycosidase family protein, partial [Synergistaceae bacterium]|nr:phosphodiester glycosidase family protein [Synergistaceae bacterium]